MHLLPGAEHGFNVPWLGTYSEAAAETAFVLAVAFLEARLRD
jgi:hypothetical protein